jgi:glycerol-3-phosphate O-acyltransferase
MRTPWLSPSALLARLQPRLFERVKVDAEWEPQVRAAARQGTVVYALRSASLVDFLALGGLARRLGLPRVELGDDITPVADLPGPIALRWAAADPAARLERTLEAGRSPVVFLKRAAGPLSVLAAQRPTRHGLVAGDHGLSALLARQRRGDVDLVVVPQVFLWSVAPESHNPGVIDVLFGRNDMPGDARALIQAAFAYRHGTLRAGTPLSLREFMASQQDAADDAVLLRRLTWALLGRLERERRAVVGPARKREGRIREEVLRSSRLRGAIRDLAGKDPAARAALVEKADGMLRELVADPDARMTRALEPLLDTLARRVFSGVDVDAEGMERVREASRRGVVVFLPSHKSHVDYLLLSWALRKHWLELPLVAAGDNLAFFPLGAILRRGGAFFIRRSFRGDRLYAAVVDAYVRRLLRDGWALELFLEGGRSRTGKLRPPQVGMLNLIVDAALALDGRELFFVPVSIGYERMLEEGELSREKEGAEKRKEDARSLLDAFGTLREPWGRANVQIGNILSLSGVRRQLGLPEAGMLAPAKRRSLVHRIAFQSMREINRVTAVTAGALVATVLLGDAGRGLSHADLLADCERLLAYVRHAGARTAPGLASGAGVLRTQAVRDALHVFARGGLVERRPSLAARGPDDVVWTVPEGARAKLDLSKNAIAHLFVDRGLVALALLAAPDRTVDRGRLAEEVLWLARLFKHEFLFRTEIPYEKVFDEGLQDMTIWGEVALDEGGIARPGPGRLGASGEAWLEVHARALAAVVEGYVVASRALRSLLRAPLPEKDLWKHALREGEGMFLARAIQRREALSRPILEAAFASFVDLGVLRRTREDELELADAHASADAVAAFEARIAAVVPRSGEPPRSGVGP